MVVEQTAAKKNAVVLVSGGLDSATCLALAIEAGYKPHALSFSYGQRHVSELAAAKRVLQQLKVVNHRVIHIDLGQFSGSALTDLTLPVPEFDSVACVDNIPITYVPARNTIFLSYALAFAEVIQADAIYIGVNAIDYSGYPDCRPAYISAFQTLANLATKRTVEGSRISIETPLLYLTKKQIIEEATRLNIDLSVTVSCYQADLEGCACGRCDSCRFRAQGFRDAGLSDTTRYV